MGQYFIITNLSKKEYIHPHDLKQGAKISEITNDKFLRGLMSFMSYNNKTVENMPYLFLGRWFNDKVILVGDYEFYLFF